MSEKSSSPLALTLISGIFKTMDLAHAAGVSWSGYDAVGVRSAISFGGAWFGAVSVDGLLNLSSGEFSLFASPEAGFLLGAGGTWTVGATGVKGLKSNDDFRGTFMAGGVIGGWGPAITGELFWSSPMADTFDAWDKAHGGFAGVGPGAGIGGYGSVSWSWEAYREDVDGGHWYPFPNPLTVAQDVGQAIWHDFVQRWYKYE